MYRYKYAHKTLQRLKTSKKKKIERKAGCGRSEPLSPSTYQQRPLMVKNESGGQLTYRLWGLDRRRA